MVDGNFLNASSVCPWFSVLWSTRLGVEPLLLSGASRWSDFRLVLFATKPGKHKKLCVMLFVGSCEILFLSLKLLSCSTRCSDVFMYYAQVGTYKYL